MHYSTILGKTFRIGNSMVPFTVVSLDSIPRDEWPANGILSDLHTVRVMSVVPNPNYGASALHMEVQIGALIPLNEGVVAPVKSALMG